MSEPETSERRSKKTSLETDGDAPNKDIAHRRRKTHCWEEAAKLMSHFMAETSISGVPEKRSLFALPPDGSSLVLDSMNVQTNGSFPQAQLNIARCARFSTDGRFVATGSADTSFSSLRIMSDSCYLIGADIKNKANDAARFKRWSGATRHKDVRYSSTGGMYVTASKDGAIWLWDGVSASCVRSIVGAHGAAEAGGHERMFYEGLKDSTVKLWEIGTGRLVKQYLGATHTQLRCQAVFSDTEEFEPSNEWQNGLPTISVPLVGSSTEPAFISCGTDRSVRFWKEIL
ncbi:hypothetical protein GQ457_08G035220 [Hibiscus cannabinus]